MKKIRLYVFLIVCLLSAGYPSVAQLRLPALISDGMVIQRDADVKIRGWADPGGQIRVRFYGRNYLVKAGDDGKWSVLLPPMEAGGPFTMEIMAGDTLQIDDIMVGDVWLCAGQSNMVHYMELHRDRYADEMAAAGYPEIRQFLVPGTPELTGPADDLPGGSWRSASPENVKRFSVVAYFFAKRLYDTYQVPIGIINASVGGTPIEAWTGSEGLKEFSDLQQTIIQNRDTAYVDSVNRAAEANRLEKARNREEDRGLSGLTAWCDQEYVPENWRRIAIPGYWEDQGVRDLDGVVWYRKEIMVPASMAGKPAKLELGRIVDTDEVYVNGLQVGHTGYQYPQRRYEVPAGLLNPGTNIMVVRVTNYGGKGGFVPDKPYHLVATGDTIDLAGYWSYQVGAVYRDEGPEISGIALQNQPSALYNGMVAPLTDFQVRGFVWYQGESNTGRPDRYRELLPALIRDWRNRWGMGDLPFVYAQLPNFMEVNYLPEESNWALLRESQTKSLELPATGMAVTIDLGEWNDIHPGNKKPVGERLALAARKVAYGEPDLVHSGPLYSFHRIEGNRVIISFKNTGSGLTSCNGESLKHFAVAGEDGRYIWGKAVIEGNTVVVWHEDIVHPAFVRYAWADNPEFANLCNEEGLPASPFRTDIE